MEHEVSEERIPCYRSGYPRLSVTQILHSEQGIKQDEDIEKPREISDAVRQPILINQKPKGIASYIDIDQSAKSFVLEVLLDNEVKSPEDGHKAIKQKVPAKASARE